MLKCPYLTANNNCIIASGLIGEPVPVTPRTCNACLKTDKPKALNVVTCSVAYQVAPSQQLLITLRQLHKTTFNKPGSCLRLILKELGIVKEDHCQCDEYAAKMDLWGTEKCEERIPEIVEHLNTQEVSWLDMTRVLLTGHISTKSLVETAISRSK